jgi:1-acyl-sn-glycerol-3-phosphate acyltransferase
MRRPSRIWNHWHFRLKPVLRFLLRHLLRLDVLGLENIPDEGPVIVYINHANFLDPFVAAGIPDREVAVMGKRELFNVPVLGLLFRLYGVFPVRREEGDVRAIRKSLQVLRRGTLLLLAPEGHRSGTGRLQRGKPGIAYIAAHSEATLVPMVVLGGLHFYSFLWRLSRTPVQVRIGEPFCPTYSRRKLSKDDAQRITDEAMYRLAALLPPELRGVYGDAGSEALASGPTARPVITGAEIG